MKKIKKYQGGGSFKSKTKDVSPNGKYAIITKDKSTGTKEIHSEKIRRTLKGVLTRSPKAKDRPEKPQGPDLRFRGELEMKKGGSVKKKKK